LYDNISLSPYAVHLLFLAGKFHFFEAEGRFALIARCCSPEAHRLTGSLLNAIRFAGEWRQYYQQGCLNSHCLSPGALSLNEHASFATIE
jgi:hypothetical protein